MTAHPELSQDIDVVAGTDIDGAWDRFEIFEALHHTMTIDNPMTSADLDQVLDLLAPCDGESALDLACGHGELLRRMRRQATIDARGIDLSPWMISAAHRYATAEQLDVRWTLGEARHFAADKTFDLVTCLGASWIWHGYNGTVRAVAQRTAPGGRIAIGEMHLRDGVDADDVAKTHGRVTSQPELDEMFEAHGIEVIGRIRTTDEAWDDYLARTRHAATEWARLHPGPRAARYLVEQHAWEHDHQRDREVLTWSVWVGRKTPLG